MSSLPDTLPRPGAARTVPLRTAGIAGIGTALPPRVVANAEIAPAMGVDAAWIERRTGIRSRRHAAPGARLADLAAEAGRAALAAAGVDAQDIDTVLVATITADELTPNAAPQVAHALGATSAGAIDIGAACTGFLSGLATGSALIEAGRADHVLLVGAEIMSRHLDPADRKTAGLFGDGAGAVVLSASAAGGLGPVVLRCDGAAARFITADRASGLVRMDGHETFKLAVSAMAASAREAIAAAGLEPADIDLFVFHQANGRMLTAIAETLGAGDGRVLDVIADIGNTSAASLPLALAAASDGDRLHPGDKILVGAAGAGFTWGAVVVEWGDA